MDDFIELFVIHTCELQHEDSNQQNLSVIKSKFYLAIE